LACDVAIKVNMPLPKKMRWMIESTAKNFFADAQKGEALTHGSATKPQTGQHGKVAFRLSFSRTDRVKISSRRHHHLAGRYSGHRHRRQWVDHWN
jgi:hypothetical protein